MTSTSVPSTKRLVLLFFLALNLFYLLTSSGRVRTVEEVTVDFQAESLAKHGSAVIPQAIPDNLFYGRLDRAGRPQAADGLGQAVIVLPWYGAGMLLRSILPGIPVGARDLVLDAVLVASSATFSALAATLALLIFLRLGIAARPALAAALLMAFATPLFSYSAYFFSEPLTAALFVAAALFLFVPEAAGSERLSEITSQQAYRGGIFLGIAMWVRPTNLLAAVIFILAVVVRERKKALRPALVLTIVVSLFAIAYLLRNHTLFGHALDFGYPVIGEGGKKILSFQTPMLRGLFGFLLSPGKSVFIFAPPILLAIAGIKRLAQRDRGLAFVAAATPIAYLLLFMKYTQWEGDYCPGPRYLIPSLALLCLSLGPVLADAKPWTRRIAWALFIVGFLVQVTTMSTSFLEDQANGSYFDQHYDYRMSYDPVVSQTRLLLHYASSPGFAALGHGFDRWFLFLVKIGVQQRIVLIFWFLEWLATIVVTWQLEGLVAKPRAET